MDRVEKLAMLQELDEKALTEKFLLPLFTDGLGCENVQYSHGVLEFGKDIIYYAEDEFGSRKYTGVQVKKTKITARSNDTIFRQINEAFGGPYVDLTDTKKKPLDRFVLITSNKFTENAKESLSRSLNNAKLQKVVTLIDGNKLLDLLDENLPSVFWDQYDYFSKYFHAMKEEFEHIRDVSAIGQKESIPLEKIYVSLKVSQKYKIEPSKERIQIDPGKPGKESQFIQEEREREKIYDTDDVTQKFKKVVIVGDPGSGKTTLLKHLTLKSCKENLKTQQRTVVPIFITLRELLESGKNLREYINDILERYNFPKAKDFIEKDLKDGLCQLFLDGFDELAS